MAGSRKFTVEIVSEFDNKGLKRLAGGIEDSQKKLDGFSGKLKAWGGNLQDFGKKATTYATVPLLALGGLAFKAAGDLGESQSKVNVVFAESAGVIEEWAKGSAKNIGVARQEALEAAGTFGNLFRSMEIGTPAAADMSRKLIELSGDLGSFNNANPTEVLEALRSGLTGETEPLRKFGVNINAARIEAEAFALGLAQPVKNATQIQAAHLKVEDSVKKLAQAQKEHGRDSLEARTAANDLARAQEHLNEATAGALPELTAAQKAQASYSLIMKDTALAQGDFSRTSDSAANAQRIATAQWKDAAATLGESLLPIGQKVIGFVSDLADKFNNLSPGMQTAIIVMAGVAAAAGPVVGAIGAIATAMAFLAANPVVLIIAGLVALGAGLVILYQKSETFRDVVNTAFRAVSEYANIMKTVMVTIFQVVANVWLTAAETIVGGAAKAFGWVPGIGPKLEGAAEAITQFKNDTNQLLGDIRDKDISVDLNDNVTPEVKRIREELRKFTQTDYTVNMGARVVLPGGTQTRASGGPVGPGRFTLVGEQGPELVEFGARGHVYPHEESVRMLTSVSAQSTTPAAVVSASASAPVNVTVNMTVNVRNEGFGTSMSDNQARELGRLVAAGVHNELLRRKNTGSTVRLG